MTLFVRAFGEKLQSQVIPALFFRNHRKGLPVFVFFNVRLQGGQAFVQTHEQIPRGLLRQPDLVRELFHLAGHFGVLLLQLIDATEKLKLRTLRHIEFLSQIQNRATCLIVGKRRRDARGT